MQLPLSVLRTLGIRGSPNRIVWDPRREVCCSSLTLYHRKPLSGPSDLSVFLSRSLSGEFEQLETALPNPCPHWKKMNMGAELFPLGLHRTDFHRKQSAGLRPSCVCVEAEGERRGGSPGKGLPTALMRGRTATGMVTDGV